MKTRLQMIETLTQGCTLLGISVDSVLRRRGLSFEALTIDVAAAPAELHFRVWEAVREEARRPDMEYLLGRAFAKGPFSTPAFGFSCAETLDAGIDRMRDFKPLVGPKRLEVARSGSTVEVSYHSSDPDHPMSASFGLFELVYLTELARTCTGVDLVPVATELPAALPMSGAVADFVGGPPRITDRVSVAFSAADAARPLLTRSPEMWAEIEPLLRAELAERDTAVRTSARVRAALTELLPAGPPGAEAMARRLNLSKRSLQRRLTDEGTSFQEVLSGTRADLAARYLRDSDLSLHEISYLLGFRDTSSFFRAFQRWYGVTPGDFRSRPRATSVA